jgi:3-phenylpropionate/cinnamic acid dioxygenase small subunit
MTIPLTADAAALIYREALLLDRLDFPAWLDLYTPDCRFWMPAWRDDGTQTNDPESELSLIYYRGRRNLEDRVARIRSGFSVASVVMPRVSHMIGNVSAEAGEAGNVGQTGIRVDSTFIVNVYDVRTKRAHAYFGRYEHRLLRDGDVLKIDEKIIRLMNDTVPTMLDVYSI